MTPFVAERIYRTLLGRGGGRGCRSSVHLTRFPEPDPALERPELTRRWTSSAARSAWVSPCATPPACGSASRWRTPSCGRPRPCVAWLPAFASDLADELNVEAVEHAAVDGGAPAEPAGRGARAPPRGGRDRRAGLALTEGLRRKGLVRQLVHQVQLLRKSAGLDVDDRIRLS